MKFLKLFLGMMLHYTNNFINERRLGTQLEDSCNSVKDCFNCTMFSQLNIYCQWNSYQCKMGSSMSEGNNWWDTFVPCVTETQSYNTMRSYCGGLLEKNPPFRAELVHTNGYYGTKNIYCRWNAVNNDITRYLKVNFTKLNPDLTDRYGLEVIYSDGRISYQTLQNKNFLYAFQFVDNIYFHYYTSKSKTELPFTMYFEYQEESYQSYLGLFISLAVIVFLCLVCSIFFYKCSRIIIENSNRQQERRAQEEINNLVMNNPLILLRNNNNNITEREEEMKKENAEKLRLLFESELKPVHYDNSLNEFGANCTICLEDFKTNSKVVKLFCKHIFHLKCIQNWCEKVLLHPKCPNCNVLIISGQREEQEHNMNNMLTINISRNNETEEVKSDNQEQDTNHDRLLFNGRHQNLISNSNERLGNQLFSTRLRNNIENRPNNDEVNNISIVNLNNNNQEIEDINHREGIRNNFIESELHSNGHLLDTIPNRNSINNDNNHNINDNNQN